MTPSGLERILVIKHGALGDFIQALGPMAAIRRYHPNAQITLLTTSPYTDLAQGCGVFDTIWIDQKPKWWNWSGLWSLRRKLMSGNFSRIYDLQNSDRTDLYLRLFPHILRPEWVGRAPGASHRNDKPSRTSGNAFAGHVETLAKAGINDITVDRLEWLQGDLSGFPLRSPYALLVPGSAPRHMHKRWPAEHYAKLTLRLSRDGIQSVILGTRDDAECIQAIVSKGAAESLNLCGRTDFGQIAALARGAVLAVGNDTGPMHLIAPTGCPSLVLFSAYSNPIRHSPLGPHVTCLQRQKLQDLDLSDVNTALKEILETSSVQGIRA